MAQHKPGIHATSPTKTNESGAENINTIVSHDDPPLRINVETNDNDNLTENGDNDPEVVLDQKTTKQTKNKGGNLKPKKDKTRNTSISDKANIQDLPTYQDLASINETIAISKQNAIAFEVQINYQDKQAILECKKNLRSAKEKGLLVRTTDKEGLKELKEKDFEVNDNDELTNRLIIAMDEMQTQSELFEKRLKFVHEQHSYDMGYMSTTQKLCQNVAEYSHAKIPDIEKKLSDQAEEIRKMKEKIKLIDGEIEDEDRKIEEEKNKGRLFKVERENETEAVLRDKNSKSFIVHKFSPENECPDGDFTRAAQNIVNQFPEVGFKIYVKSAHSIPNRSKDKDGQTYYRLTVVLNSNHEVESIMNIRRMIPPGDPRLEITKRFTRNSTPKQLAMKTINQIQKDASNLEIERLCDEKPDEMKDFLAQKNGSVGGGEPGLAKSFVIRDGMIKLILRGNMKPGEVHVKDEAEKRLNANKIKIKKYLEGSGQISDLVKAAQAEGQLGPIKNLETMRYPTALPTLHQKPYQPQSLQHKQGQPQPQPRNQSQNQRTQTQFQPQFQPQFRPQYRPQYRPRFQPVHQDNNPKKFYTPPTMSSGFNHNHNQRFARVSHQPYEESTEPTAWNKLLKNVGMNQGLYY